MLYYKLNCDAFVPIKEVVKVTKYIDNKSVGFTNEFADINIGDIFGIFCAKLLEETGVAIESYGSAMHDVLGIPCNTFSVDDEKIASDFDVIKMINFILVTYAHKQIYNEKSLVDLGIKIEFCKKISNKEASALINDYMGNNSLQYTTEDILWKNMTDDEKAVKFAKYLTDINAPYGELIVVDPYIFSDDSDDYCDMLVRIFKLSRISKVTVITEQNGRNYKSSSFNRVKTKLNTQPYYIEETALKEFFAEGLGDSCEGKERRGTGPIAIDVKFSNDFHDRFWIANKNMAFCTGTSFNGIGKKIAVISMISDEDTSDVIMELGKQGLL